MAWMNKMALTTMALELTEVITPEFSKWTQTNKLVGLQIIYKQPKEIKYTLTIWSNEIQDKT